MKEINTIEEFNTNIEKCETWADATNFFKRIEESLLKEFIETSAKAITFNLLTMRGQFMLNYAQVEYNNRPK